jgi:hypothetical protein
MGIIAAGLAITAAVITVLLLVAFRAGTRRQEQSGSLARRAPGPAAGLTRRITGLHAETPPSRRAASVPGAADRGPGTVPSGKGTRTS